MDKKKISRGSLLSIIIIAVTVIAILFYAVACSHIFKDIYGDNLASGTTSSIKDERDKPNSNKGNKDKSKIEQEVLAEIPILRQKIKEGRYDEVKIKAGELLKKSPNNPHLLNIMDSSSNIIEYTGIVEHIFFHPLIAYPNRAFKSQGQDMFMVTVYEFKKVLEEVYKRGYILVDLMDLYSVQHDESGKVIKVTPNKLMLPEGKKPLVISIDDLNYYQYMLKDGQVFKLVLDKNGEIETYSVDESGKEVYSKDNEIVPILDEFVRQHPDFSFNGAKGTINLTGYEGILGYRTNSLKYPNFESERQEALKVVAQLKKTGWSFASHSQGHRHFAQVSYSLVVEDTDRFIVEVESLIGKTPLFVYPYGEQVPVTDPKFQYLQSKGFGVFCGVSKYPGTKLGETYAIMNRRNIDGIALKDNRHNQLYEAKDVTDPVRPWYNEFYGNKAGDSSAVGSSQPPAGTDISGVASGETYG